MSDLYMGGDERDWVNEASIKKKKSHPKSCDNFSPEPFIGYITRACGYSVISVDAPWSTTQITPEE